MRKSKVETEETRNKIVETASRQFRRNGIHATGLADVMTAAGLTHGGFYRHFQSKDQLVAEACASGMASLVAVVEAAGSKKNGKKAIEAIIDNYLAAKHRDDPASGCAYAAVGSELARADAKTRTVATEWLLKLVEAIAKPMHREKSDIAKSDAIFVLSAMLGAITLSRIVTDPKLATSILRDVRNRLAEN
jgi:TetR/AcrR family transcriptional repressor of nem operon